MQKEVAEDTGERRKILSGMLSYQYSRFHSKIIEAYPHIFDDLTKRSTHDLTEDLELIKAYIKQRRNGEQFRSQFQNLLTACDTLAKFIGLETEGASAILLHDEEVLDTLEEIRLKYEVDATPEPEFILATTIFATYLKVNAKNKLDKKLHSDQVKKGIQENLDLPASKILEKDFADL